MAEVINELSLLYVKYKGETLYAVWELNGGDVSSCAGIEYSYEISRDGIKEVCKDFTDQEGNADAEITWKAETDSSYEFRLYVRDQPNASDQCELVTGRFANPMGNFDGERFTFCWELSGGMVSDGYFKIQKKDTSGKELMHIPVSPYNRRYVTEPVHLAVFEQICAVFAASDGKFCEGPDSEPLYFVPKGTEILEASLEENIAPQKDGETEKEAVSSLKLKIRYESSDMKHVQVLLKKDGRLLYRSASLDIRPVTEKSQPDTEDKGSEWKPSAAEETGQKESQPDTEDKGSEWKPSAAEETGQKENQPDTGDGETGLAEVTAEICSTQIRPDLLCQCVASCVYISGNAVSDVMTEMSEISLAKPQVIPLAVGKECRAAVRIQSEIEPVGYELTGNPHLIAREGSCTADFTARARYDTSQGIQRKGPVSASAYPECFYADEETVCYKKDASLTEHKIFISAAYFQELPGEEICEEGLALQLPDEKKSGCTLVIKTDTPLSKDACQSFIKKLTAGGSLSPEGYYKICEIILRMGAYAKEDTAFFQCRYQPDGRCVDVFPGLILRVETAVYLPQYDAKIKKAAGFAWMNTSETEVYFSTGRSGGMGRGGVLEWNSCASGMFEKANEGLSAAGTDIIYAAGTMDLMRTNVRQPYYRILYPSALLQPDEVTPYPSDNSILLAADEYGKILDACELMQQNPAAISSLQIPVVLFRGRGMLTLLTQISINGEICRIPIGTTLQQALAVRGITSLEHVKLYRRGIHGKELPVYGSLAGILPLQGDRAEV